MEYSPEILGDFTEEANVMVCTRLFTNEKETGRVNFCRDMENEWANRWPAWFELDFRTFAVKNAIRRNSDEVIKVALDYKRDESTENKSDCLQQGIPVGRK